MPMSQRTLRPRTAEAAAPTGTPASLLLHFDGNFNDSSPNNLTVTPVDGAAISTTQSKFGGSSGYFDDGAKLTVPSSASVSGTGDFTVEFWVWIESAQDAQVVVAGASGLTIALGYGGRRVWAQSPSFVTPYDDQIGVQEWHHIAVARASGVAAIYIDGIAKVSGSMTNNFQSSQVTVGANGGEYLIGYLDDLRIVNGLAVYTSNFTPPTGLLSAYV